MTAIPLDRLAGWFYIFATLCFIVAVSIRSRIFVAGDTAVTLENLRSSGTLARIGLMVDVVSVFAFLLTAVALYLLLADVDHLAAGLMVIFVVMGVPLGLLALAAQLSALSIAERPAELAAGAADATRLLTEMQTAIRTLHETTAGLWLLPLGYLALRSGYFPQIVGVLLIVAGISWLIHLALVVLAPQLTRAASLVVLGAIGEVIFMIWLVVRGADRAIGS